MTSTREATMTLCRRNAFGIIITLLGAVVAGLILGVNPAAAQSDYEFARLAPDRDWSFVDVSIPGADQVRIQAIDDAGNVAGWFYDADDVAHGFVMAADGTVRVIDIPGAESTFIYAMNNAGDVGGTFFTEGSEWGVSTGFVLSANGTLNFIDVLNAISVTVTGLNEQGDIGGHFSEVSTPAQGFVQTAGGSVTTFGAPWAADGSGSYVRDIDSNGNAAGYFSTDSGRIANAGFVRSSDGTFTDIRYFIPSFSLQVHAMNDLGDVAGYTEDVDGRDRPFVLTPDGVWTEVDHPDYPYNFQITALNNRGEIAGWYSDDGSPRQAFIAQPPQPVDAFSCDSNAGGLSWNDAGQAKYWIYKSTDGGATFNWLGRATGNPAPTTFTDRAPAPGATYQVHYPGIPRTECTVTAEPAPVDTFACANNDGELSWSDAGQAKYWIYKSTDSGIVYRWVGRTAGETSFIDAAADESAIYQVHYPSYPRITCLTPTLSGEEPAAVELPTAIEAEHYFRALDTEPGNQGLATEFAGDVDVWPMLAGDGFIVGRTRTGESTSYKVTAPTTDTYEFAISTASGIAGSSVTLRVDGTKVGGTTRLAGTGGWWSFAETTLGSIELAAGPHVVTVQWGDGQSNFDKLIVTGDPRVELPPTPRPSQPTPVPVVPTPTSTSTPAPVAPTPTPTVAMAQAWLPVGDPFIGSGQDGLGEFVAMNGDGTSVVVASGSSKPENERAYARVFDWDGAQWVQRGDDLDNTADPRIVSVTMSADGDTVAVLFATRAPLVSDWNGASWIDREFRYEAALDGYIGGSVALDADGSTLVVGQPSSDASYRVDSGVVSVYDWIDSQWRSRQRRQGAASFDAFGSAVSIDADGRTVVVGAPGHDGNGVDAGEVHVLWWDGNIWIDRDGSILGAESGERFGTAVDISADGYTIAAGAPTNGPGGHVHVLDWTGEEWVDRGNNIDDVTGRQLGLSVALSADGDHIVAGGLDVVRVQAWIAGAWESASPDPGLPVGGGVDVSADGDAIIVGSPFEDGLSGRATVLATDAQGPQEDPPAPSPAPSPSATPAPVPADAEWVQLGQDLGGETRNEDFGEVVDMNADGTTIIVGAYEFADRTGRVRVFDVVDSAWVQRGEDFVGEGVGYSVSIDATGDTIAMTTFTSTDQNARVYDWDGVAWVQRGVDLPDATHGAVLSPDGTALALANAFWRIPFQNDAIGRVQVFEWNNEAWIQRGNDIYRPTGDRLGSALAMSDDAMTVSFGPRGWVYHFDGDIWVQRGEIPTGPSRSIAGTEVHATALSASGTTAAILYEGDDTPRFVRVYQWDGASWIAQGDDLVAPDSYATSVAMSPDGFTVLIGYAGSDLVRSYRWTGTDWAQFGGDILGQIHDDPFLSGRYDAFGASVAMSDDGERVVVGGNLYSGVAFRSGYVRVYNLAAG